MPFIDPFADPIAPRFIVSQPVPDMHQYVSLDFPLHHLHLLIDIYRPEFIDNYHQGLTETHSDGPIVMPLPSFVDVAASKRIQHTPSKSSLKNGTTGYLTDTESVFFTFMIFLSFSLTSFLFSVKLSLFFLTRARHPIMNQRPIFKQVRIHSHVTLCLFLLSSILLPNRRLPTETPTFGANMMILIQHFTL